MLLSLVTHRLQNVFQGDPQHVLLHDGRGPVHRLGGDLPPLLRHQPPALPQRRTGFYKVKKVFSSPWFQLLLARPSRPLGTRQCSSSRRSGFPSTASSTSISPTGSSTSRSQSSSISIPTSIASPRRRCTSTCTLSTTGTRTSSRSPASACIP